MTIGENAKLGFLGHTDTVEIIDGWDTNPFELTKKDNQIFATYNGGISRKEEVPCAAVATVLSGSYEATGSNLPVPWKLQAGGVDRILQCR